MFKFWYNLLTMVFIRTLSVSLIICFFAGFSAGADFTKAKNGELVLQAAANWLELIEKGEYLKSWDEASVPFQNSVKRPHWRTYIRNFKTTLGPLVHRANSYMYYEELDEKILTCTLYFTSQYEKRTVPRETLYLIFENNQWKVAGYLVK